LLDQAHQDGLLLLLLITLVFFTKRRRIYSMLVGIWD